MVGMASMAGSQEAAIRAEAVPKPLVLTAPVQDKNFYLLSLLERDGRVSQLLAEDAGLQSLYRRKSETLAQVFERSRLGDAHTLSELQFGEAEIQTAADSLAALYRQNVDVRRLVDGPLRRSGMYARYQKEEGSLLFASAWRDCARGVNNILSVYGLGNAGRSPDIDSISYDAKGFLYGALVHNLIGAVQEDLNTSTTEHAPTETKQTHAKQLFFAPGLKFALSLLEANRRDEAGRFEPMERGENRAAFRRIPTIKWEKYPYTLILIPGYGPEEAGVSLSPIGKLALTLAVRRYREGKAPFLLVSGGYVHPRQTPYCEAMEMKRSLMRDFGIPENAILIDPHARHTTTNLRNAARIMFRYGIPCDRPGLITTNTFQSADIESVAFHDRCQRVFGYQPHEVLKRLSPFDLEFRPRLDSLYADPQDPLDP